MGALDTMKVLLYVQPSRCGSISVHRHHSTLHSRPSTNKLLRGSTCSTLRPCAPYTRCLGGRAGEHTALTWVALIHCIGVESHARNLYKANLIWLLRSVGGKDERWSPARRLFAPTLYSRISYSPNCQATCLLWHSYSLLTYTYVSNS